MRNLLFFVLLSSTFFSLNSEQSPSYYDHYGQQGLFSGSIEKRAFYHQQEKSTEELWILTLDQPIDTLPMPLIGEAKKQIHAITEVLLYVSASDKKRLENCLEQSHIHIQGSLWYADWWKEDLPFLIIVDSIF